jgi:hypothetical protein
VTLDKAEKERLPSSCEFGDSDMSSQITLTGVEHDQKVKKPRFGNDDGVRSISSFDSVATEYVVLVLYDICKRRN